MNVDSDQFDLLILAAAGIAYREAASYIVTGTALVVRAYPDFDADRLLEWAVILADFAHELDPAHQRLNPEDQHGPTTKPI